MIDATSGTFNPFSEVASDEINCVKIRLNDLPPNFRKARVRREDGDNSIAVGWPISSGVHRSAPKLWPIGLFAGKFSYTEDHLCIYYDINNVLVNPHWIKENGATMNWQTQHLEKIFSADSWKPLEFVDFRSKLKEVAAGHYSGKLTGSPLTPAIDVTEKKVHDSFGIFLTDDNSFNIGTIENFSELQKFSDEKLNASALGYFFDNKKDNKTKTQTPSINLGLVNAEQIDAISSACQSGITVVTGPPGTGKSETVVSIVGSELLAGGSVLFASKNHQALDAVQDRLKAIAPDVDFLVRTLESGNSSDNSFRTELSKLLTVDEKIVPAPDLELKSRLASLSKLRSKSISDIKHRNSIECEIADLLNRIGQRNKDKNESRTNTRQNEVVKRKSFTDWLIVLINKFSGRGNTKENTIDDVSSNGASTQSLQNRLKDLRALKEKISKPDDPIKLTEEIREISLKILPNYLANKCRLTDDELQSAIAENDLHNLSSDKKVIPQKVAKIILKAKPLWLASVQGAARRIPLYQNIFDIVIFDEASQCDIATAIPLMYRAKKVVIVGDDKQLSYIPQLGRSQDVNLMQVHELPVEKMTRYSQSQMSLFDSGIRVPNVEKIILKDQYRSAPQIVEYISDTFYNGKLRSATHVQDSKVPANLKPGITWTDVKPLSGSGADNINHAEIRAIVSHLKVLLLEEKYAGHVGFVSPFRAQVMEFERHILEELPDKVLKKAKFKAGTVDSFQGDERDLILFSPTVTLASPTSAITFVQRDLRRLNVAISRAKAVAHIFGDLDFAKSGKIRSLTKLANFATKPLRKKIGENVFDSEWERRVYHVLRDRGFDPIPQYQIAGRRLDFALFGRGDVKVDLEVDGRRWHTDIDGNRKVGDLWRDHQLRSMGWRVLRFWVDELDRDMEKCIERIQQELS